MGAIRYPWWGFIKYIIEQYAEADPGDLSRIQKSQWQAVHDALDDLSGRDDGADRLTVVRLVLINRTHTVSGAAMAVPCSERTAAQWHGDFIRCVARHYGLL